MNSPLPWLLLLCLALAGCVTKAQANAQARQAFFAGQQEARRQMQAANQSQAVTLTGNVSNSTVEWTPGLTLAQALIAAEYTGPGDPTEIILVRGGFARPIDPKTLLEGQDTPLRPGDVVQIK